jgi:hypothetical protein
MGPYHCPGELQPVAEPTWTDSPDWDATDQHAQYLRAGGSSRSSDASTAFNCLPGP